MFKFAVIGALTENTQDLLRAISVLGHSGVVLKLTDIVFETRKKDFVAKCGDYDFDNFDIIIFRGYNEHIYEAKLLAEMLVRKNKTIIEQTLAGSYVRGKMQQAERILQAGINHPATFQANNLESWQKILDKMSFPIIAKPVFGRKGRGIQKLNNSQEALEFFKFNFSDYLAQQYFPIKNDFRVLIVGNKVVGGFQRFINEGQYKSNIYGTKAKKIKINEEMKEIAIKATEAMNYELAGVDLFQYDGKFYVIEVNVSPQWEKFKFVTGINPARDIIEYAIAKHLGKK
ncbi:MAG: RimK family alpha-L-glutamate ligase [Candidatus Moranbacteria bacterium]|nr:RimK family alpha-L-glutamate ligase [Candidatus Moranbacteria bacterium]